MNGNDLDYPGPEFYDEPADPRLDWAKSPVLGRQETLAIIEKNRNLDGRGINLFRTALTRVPKSGLISHYVEPHLIQPGAYYIYTTPEPTLFKYANCASGDHEESMGDQVCRVLRGVFEHAGVD